MIRNDREFKITKAQAASFEKALADATSDTSDSLHPMIRQAQLDAMRSQLDELQAELAEYEALKEGRRDIIEVASLEDLPKALIQGRIAARLTQRELAKRLGMREQQVQRYEATEYASVSFSRLAEIAKVIGIRCREEVFLPHVDVSEKMFVQRLKKAGIDAGFINRILLGRTPDDETDDAARAIEGASAASRVFGWPVAEMFAPKTQLPRLEAGAAAFKVYATAAEGRTLYLAAFGAYVARLVLKSTPALKPKTIPDEPRTFRELLLARSGRVDLETALAVLWDFGVPVVPLAEPGGYHGACWRFDGRNVIVLKQRTTSEERWLHDLFHEVHHAASSPEEAEFEWLDEETMPVERRKTKEEKLATKFSGNVLLDSRAEDLAKECVRAAGSRAQLLKGVVPQVARKHGVAVGALANYLAWRVAMDGINWWGAAANLQQAGGNPWRVTRDFLAPRLDWSQLDAVERALLGRSLQEEID